VVTAHRTGLVPVHPQLLALSVADARSGLLPGFPASSSAALAIGRNGRARASRGPAVPRW
jgi:hypothetical protein